jgi:signal-transduction protein with cAMP-binding, CBS, and nucleotidyltransferase domain
MIKESLYEEAGQVYDQLMGMRLAHQARSAEQGRTPNNELETAELTHLEETLLRQALSQMGNLQKKISFDFLGSA